MSLLAFIGDPDKSNQEKIINLLKAVSHLDEFRNIDSSDLFSDPQRIYIIIDDLVINIPRGALAIAFQGKISRRYARPILTCLH